MTDTQLIWENGKRVILGGVGAAMFPLLVLSRLSSNQTVIRQDVARWAAVLECPIKPYPLMLLGLLASYPAFRNLFYFRLATSSLWLRVLAQLGKQIYHECSTLSLSARESIGPGLFIQHGFSTIVAAESMGSNCFIHQQVTIGFRGRSDCPTLGDYVVVGAGAKILGSVRVGNHVVVGANAVVVKNVPDNCVVAGVPARILRRDGVRVDEALA